MTLPAWGGRHYSRRVALTGRTRNDARDAVSINDLNGVEKEKIGFIKSCVSSPMTDMDNQVVVSDYAAMDRVIQKAGCNVLLIQRPILRNGLSFLAVHFFDNMKIRVQGPGCGVRGAGAGLDAGDAGDAGDGAGGRGWWLGLLAGAGGRGALAGRGAGAGSGRRPDGVPPAAPGALHCCLGSWAPPDTDADLDPNSR